VKSVGQIGERKLAFLDPHCSHQRLESRLAAQWFEFWIEVQKQHAVASFLESALQQIQNLLAIACRDVEAS
jgi:hypothetical protein